MSDNMYLKFESNQVLSEKHLNETVSYLESQIRRTRNALLGAGIISGFEVERTSAATLKIFTGTGVSSEGYIAQLESENFQGVGDKKHIVYDKIKPYAPANLTFPYLEEGDSVVQYPQFQGLTAADVKLLVPNTEANDGSSTALLEGDLSNKVVVLFLEITAKELKNCEADNCYDYGKEIIFKVQPLLLSRDNAIKLINNELQSTNLVESVLRDKLLARFKLAPLPLAKPRFNTITDTLSVTAWADLFKSKLSNLSTELSTNAKSAGIDTALSTILDSPVTPLGTFVAKLNSYLTNAANVPATNLGTWQYIYDFAVDFIDGYNELVDALLDFLSYRIKSNLAFPLHLRLGLVPAVGQTTKIYNPADELFRHTFYAAQNVNEQQQAYHTALTLAARLSKIVERFVANNLLQYATIRVTPDASRSTKLSLRSIPFYYTTPGQVNAPDVKVLWNADYTRWNRQNVVLNYGQNTNTVTYTDGGIGVESFEENTLLPLLYRQKNAEFYRIEGVLGTQYGTAYSTILNYRNTYNLPFELVMLKLNKNVNLPILNQEVYFMDLESLYNVLKVEITCLLAKSKNYFSSIKIDSNASITANFGNFTTASEAKSGASGGGVEAKSFIGESAKSSGMSFITDFPQAEPIVAANTVDFDFLQNSIGYYYSYQHVIPAILQSFLNPTQSNAVNVLNAIEGVSKAITAEFKDFNADTYKTKVDTLHSAALTFINYAKGQTDAFFIQQKLVKKGALLDFLDRIYYECDWKKLEAVGKEKQNRMNYIFKQNLLSEFIKYNPGVEHVAGVPKGGTYLLIFNESGTVVGDLAIPYILNSSLPPIQYVLGVIQSIVIAGQVKNAQGIGQPTAQFSIDNVAVALDSQGRYAKSVAANQSYVLKAVLNGFTTNQQIVTIAENDVIQDIILVAINEQPKTKVNFTVKRVAGTVVAGASIVIDGKTLTTDATGLLSLDVNTNTDYPYSVSLNGFYPQNAVASVKTVPLAVNIVLHSKVLATITVLDETGKPFTNATVTIDGLIVTTQANNVYTQDIDGDVNHNLKVTAGNYATYTEVLTPAGKPVNKTVTLTKVDTLAVHVGVYTREKDNTSVRAEDGAITYLTNKDVSVFLSKKELEFPDISSFFETNVPGPKTYALNVVSAVTQKSVFSQNIALEDKDLIILAPINTKPNGIYSIQIIAEGKPQTPEAVNRLLAKILNYGRQVIVTRSVDIRLFTDAEFSALQNLLTENQIEFTSRILV